MSKLVRRILVVVVIIIKFLKLIFIVKEFDTFLFNVLKIGRFFDYDFSTFNLELKNFGNISFSRAFKMIEFIRYVKILSAIIDFLFCRYSW